MLAAADSPRAPPAASASCVRIMMASVNPRSSITSASTHVHDADALVIDAGDPLAPQVGPPALDSHQYQKRRQQQCDDPGRHQRHAAGRTESRLQLSLPNMSALQSSSGRHRAAVGDDRLEQAAGHGGESRRRLALARPSEAGVGGRIEHAARAYAPRRATARSPPAARLATSKRMSEKPSPLNCADRP